MTEFTLSTPKDRRLAWLGVLSAAVATVALSGCWGDDNNDVAAAPTPAPVPAPPSASGEVFSGPVPESAGASSQAFVSYIAALPSSDTVEPLDVSTFTPPAEDNTSEPLPIPPAS